MFHILAGLRAGAGETAVHLYILVLKEVHQGHRACRPALIAFLRAVSVISDCRTLGAKTAESVIQLHGVH